MAWPLSLITRQWPWWPLIVTRWLLTALGVELVVFAARLTLLVCTVGLC